jgi:hypothetical protein
MQQVVERFELILDDLEAAMLHLHAVPFRGSLASDW